jgi:hypothetical protein
MDIVGWVIGVIGIVVGIIGILDARRQRALGERLSQHQSETIHNLRGFLLAVKGWTVMKRRTGKRPPAVYQGA